MDAPSEIQPADEDRPIPLTKENVDAALERCRDFLGPYDRDNVFIDFENLSVDCVRDLLLLATAYRGGAGDDERTLKIRVEGGVLQDVDNLPEGWAYTLDDRDLDEIDDEDEDEAASLTARVVFRPNATDEELALFDVRFGCLRRTEYQQAASGAGRRFAVYVVPDGGRDAAEAKLEADEIVRLYSFEDGSG